MCESAVVLLNSSANYPLSADFMKMGRINITVNDKLEQEFRLEAAKKFGFKKGSLNQAMEEALKLWIREGKK